MFASELRLSDRQRKCLYWLALGLNNREIAQKLYISHGSACLAVRQMLEILGARNRAHAVHIAWELGVLPRAG